MENKTKIKFNQLEYVLKQNQPVNEFVINKPQITVKKLTLTEKIKETGSDILNKTKKVFKFIMKPFSTIAKSVKKLF